VTGLVTEEQLFAGLAKHDKLKLSLDRLRNYLDMMSKDKKTPILTKVLAPPGYTINAAALVDILKQKTVESIVLHKFGAPSLRIWRLLLTKHMAEQKQISELAMIPVKDTRDRLYKMLSKDVVQLQEVPKSADHQPNKTFYLWSVRREQVNLLFVGQIYKAMHNMKLRLFHHLELSADVLNKAEEEEKLQQQGTNISVLSNQDKQALQRLKTIQDLLLNSLLQLDETLMILKDF
jgi:DNA-directed RNA polymerase III subunit RPC3